LPSQQQQRRRHTQRTICSPNPVRLAMVNYYKILKVSQKATAAEIKSAYRRLAREMHPDVNGDKKDAARDFAQLAKAYEILSNEQERAYFDRQLRKSQSNSSLHTSSDSVFYSDNPHAKRIRQMAIERRYNAIIDQMIDSDRKETLALQQAIFPTVALFVSTCFVAIFKPLIWTNSQAIGKIILLTLFIVALVHLAKRLRSGFEHYTYKPENLHDSILEAVEPETKPYSRFAGITFLVLGIGISLGVGLVIGDYLQMSVTTMMPKFFSTTLHPEFLFYPPIAVLLVDLMHSFATKMDY
jgi:curved DNA-binding protein CbpA